MGMEGAKEEFVLTPREIAIAQGKDPDTATKSESGDAKEGGGAGKIAEAPVLTDAGPAAVEALSGTDAHPDPTDDEAVTGLAAEAEAGDKEVSAPDWATSDVQGLAVSYGLSVEDLAEMSGPDEFLRLARRLDRALQAETKPVEAQPEQKLAEKPPTKAEVAELNAEAFANYEPEVQAFVKSHAALQAEHRANLERVDKLERAVADYFASQQKSQEDARTMAFHRALDKLDPELFGKSLDGDTALDLDPKFHAVRKQVRDTAEQILPALVRQNGGKMPSLEVVLARAYRVEFAAELIARERKAYQEKVAAQAAKRRPAPGKTKAVEAAQAEVELTPAQKIANHPDVVKAWKKATGE